MVWPPPFLFHISTPLSSPFTFLQLCLTLSAHTLHPPCQLQGILAWLCYDHCQTSLGLTLDPLRPGSHGNIGKPQSSIEMIESNSITSSSSISPINVLLVPQSQLAQSAQSSLNVCYCAIMNKSESNDFISSWVTNNGASNAGTNKPVKPAYLYSTTSIIGSVAFWASYSNPCQLSQQLQGNRDPGWSSLLPLCAADGNHMVQGRSE